MTVSSDDFWIINDFSMEDKKEIMNKPITLLVIQTLDE
jgi:hypothetical protein